MTKTHCRNYKLACSILDQKFGYLTEADPSECCNIRPFFDHVAQFSPTSTLSLLFKTRIVWGVAAVAGFETLQTRKSPSAVCVTSMSDFCFAEDACHARLTIGEGARDVDKVCRMVKVGCSAAINMDPLR